MANTENTNPQDQLEIVESKFGQTEKYIEDNRNVIFGVIIAIVAVILGFMAYQKYIKKPKEIEAASQMFQAENYFQRDSFNLALNGDGNYPGFLKIINDYSGTPASNLAKYYAGICYYNTQEYDKALECLNGFSTKDNTLNPISKGIIGDCWMEKGDFNKAQKYYNEAANSAKENTFVAPIYLNKLAKSYEKQNKFQEALDTYKKIKFEYPTSNEGKTIDRNIATMNIKLGK